jgi:salicylate hydroxylase
MSGSAADLPIIIVGGGIGGLCAALALSQRGRRVTVLERSPEMKEIGAGIQLGPNVFRVFDRLGLTEDVSRDAVVSSSRSCVTVRPARS